MQHTTLASGLVTSALALGCARLGSALTPLGRRECIDLIDQAFALGVRHFDTASIYGQGDSERYLGEALQRHRGQVCLSSKAGQRLSAKQALVARFKTPIRWFAAQRGGLHRRVANERAGGVPRCFEPAWIEASLHASLKRLRTDHLDVFYLHSPSAEVLADAALMARIAALRRQGLFRAFGVSCDDHDVAWRAAATEGVDIVQFAFDDTSDVHALMRAVAAQGKRAVLRGFMQGTGAASAPSETLAERFQRVLGLPGFGGLIIGTTNPQHLRANVTALGRTPLECST